MKPQLYKRSTALLALVMVLMGFAAQTTQATPSDQGVIGEANHVYLWDATTGTLLNGFDYDEEQDPFSVLLNQDGSHVITAFPSGDVWVYNVNLPRIARIAERHFAQEGSTRNAFPVLVPIHQPNQVLVQEHEHFWLWDYAADRVLVEGSQNWVQPNPDGSRLLAGDDSSVRVFDTATGEELFSILTSRVLVRNWSPDGSAIALVTMDGAFVYDAASGAARYERIDDRFGDAYSEMLWSPDGSTLMAVASPSLHYEDTEILLIDTATMTERLSIPFDTGVFSAQWSADSAQILIADFGAEGAQVIDARTGDQIASIGFTDEILYAAWDSTESRVVMLLNGIDHLIVWDAKNQTSLFEVSTSGVIDLAWAPDHTAVLARLWPDSVVYVIDFDNFTGNPIRLTHADNVNGVVWSDDGTRIATWTGRSRG